MLLYIHRCAGVSEWQTMWTQNPLVVIPCGFDPHHRHKNPQPQGWGFFAGGGGRTERRWKHRKQSPSGALFSSRVSPYRNQYRGRSRGRFKVFPSRKAGGFLLVVGVEQSGGGNTANKAPVGLCLARGCHRIGSSTGAEAVGGLRFSPAARLGVFAGGGGHRTSATAVVNPHNPLLDALLSTEYRDAAKHKVQLRLDLCDLEHFPLRDTELVTVMCNLLDNAIRAAEGTEAFLRIWFHRAMIDPGEQKAL